MPDTGRCRDAHGKVEPGGLPVTSCEFEYGTSTSYGHSEHANRPKRQSGRPAETRSPPKHHEPTARYDLSLPAARGEQKRPSEPSSRSPARAATYRSPPPAQRRLEAPATNTTATTATLNGEVNPGGLPLSPANSNTARTANTKLPAFRKQRACEHPDATEIGEGSSPVSVHADLTGLAGSTTYRFRLVVKTEVFATKEVVTVRRRRQGIPDPGARGDRGRKS